jgi:Spy/CpxP family protein refolding chaperone
MKIRMLTLGLILASGAALAQPAPHGSPGASEKHPYAVRMKDELGLTDEQVAKMREIREGGGTREEMQAVLTPEQRAKAAQLKQSQKGERRARVQQELGLSDEQMEKMNEIKRNGGTREEMRAVMTPEQQAKFDAMRSKRPAHGPAPKPAAATPATPASPATPATSTSTATPAKPATPATPAAPAAKPATTPAS